MSDNTKKPLKLPWSAARNVGYGHLNGCQITRDIDGLVVAVTIGDVPELDAKAFAEFIVRAVNSHDEMLAELRSILSWALTEKAPLRHQEIKHLDEVISRAEARARIGEPSP